MSIKEYECDGKTYYKVYVCALSGSGSGLRVQKRATKIEDLNSAIKIEKKLTREVISKLAVLENRDTTWLKVIDEWEKAACSGYLGQYSKITIKDYRSAMLKWTREFLKTEARKINSSDIYYILRKMQEAGMAYKTQKYVKETINVIFKFGLNQRLIKGVDKPPTFGVKLGAIAISV